MLLVVGAFDIIQGLVALLKKEVYLVGENGLIITTNFTAWGWALLIWGIILVLAALLISSRLLARVCVRGTTARGFTSGRSRQSKEKRGVPCSYPQ